MKALRLILCLIAGIFTARAELHEGLVAYWPFDTVNVDTTPDLVSGQHLYLYNLTETNLVAGRYNQALSFDGVSQFAALNYSQHPKLPVSQAPAFTITLWVKGSPGQKNRMLFSEGQTTDRLPLFLMGTHLPGESASVNVMIRDAAKPTLDNLTGEATVFDGKWHHVAWVDENGSAKLYIDGMLDVTPYHYERKRARLNYLAIGALLREPPMYYFQGVIDEVAIWNRALSQSEIPQIMQGDLITALAKKKAEN